MNTKKLTIICCTACAAFLAAVTPASAQGNVLVLNVNGQTTVHWRGKQVFAGPTEGPVRGLSAGTDKEEYAAAFDGDVLLWESVPGAAVKVKSAAVAAASLDRRSRSQGRVVPARQKRPVSSGLWVVSTNDLTTVMWNGQQVFVGPTKGPVTAAAKVVSGDEAAAVFEGKVVLWENKKDAAKSLK
jgi:hypothetical protein